MKKLELTEGKDMTLDKFVDWLNEKFGSKESGKEFTAQDAYGYVKRGCIPLSYGLFKLKQVDYPKVGIKLIRIVELSEKN